MINPSIVVWPRFDFDRDGRAVIGRHSNAPFGATSAESFPMETGERYVGPVTGSVSMRSGERLPPPDRQAEY